MPSYQQAESKSAEVMRRDNNMQQMMQCYLLAYAKKPASAFAGDGFNRIT
jgi:hypothetical protein